MKQFVEEQVDIPNINRFGRWCMGKSKTDINDFLKNFHPRRIQLNNRKTSDVREIGEHPAPYQVDEYYLRRTFKLYTWTNRNTLWIEFLLG